MKLIQIIHYKLLSKKHLEDITTAEAQTRLTQSSPHHRWRAVQHPSSYQSISSRLEPQKLQLPFSVPLCNAVVKLKHHY